MKPCIACGETRALGAFYAHPRMADGHLNKCKECCRAYAKERYHKKMKDPAWRRAERRRSRVKIKRRASARRAMDPHKKRANAAVANAVRDGRLTPADCCEDCGHDFSEFRREAHHPDYDEPLEVEWLCSLCHGKRHRRAA